MKAPCSLTLALTLSVLLMPQSASAKVVVEHTRPSKQSWQQNYQQQPNYPDQYYGSSRKRVKDLQRQRMEQAEEELIDEYLDENDRPLTRRDIEEIMDRKLDERQLGKKPVQAEQPKEEPSPFGAVGGLGPVGFGGGGSIKNGGGMQAVPGLGGGQ